MDVGQVTFSIQANGLDTTIDKVSSLEGMLNGMDGKTYGKNVTKANKKVVSAAKKNEDHILRAKQKALRLAANAEKKYAIQQHARNLKNQKIEAMAAQKYRKQWQRNLVNAGAQMQTLGATLQRFTSPFMNVYTGFTRMAGFMLYGKVMDSITNAFSRYDTINTYAKSLKLLGLTADKEFSIGTEKARTAIENLEQSVLGLPTGLDEMVAAMRRYAGATGNVERATKLAIAANNAYIAGNMDDRQKLFTERQLLSLAGGAELSSNQWDSLRRNAPLAVRAVAEEMHKGVQEMIDDLKEGRVSGQEFLDTFISVGTQGKLKDAAQVMKQTWDAVGQNIQNALNRAGEGVLKALDSVFQTLDGRSFLQHVLGVDKKGNDMGDGIRSLINDMSQSAQDWIKAHPEKIIDFFNSLRDIDFKGIAGGFAEMGLMLGKMYGFIAKFISGDTIKFMVGLNVLGKAIQLIGGLTKGLSTPLSFLFQFIRFGSVGKVTKAFTEMTKAGKAAETMTFTWQGIANKGLNIASIGVIAWAIRELALAFVDIGRMNVSPEEFAGFAAGAAALIAEFAGLAQLLGAKGALTGIAQASRALGELEIGAIAQDIILMAKAMNDISSVKVPKEATMKRVFDSIEGFAYALPPMSVFEAIGKFFSSKAVTHTAEAVSKVTEAINSVNGLKGSLKKFAKIMFGENAKGAGHGGGSWGGEPESIVEIMTMMLDQFENNKVLETLTDRWNSSNIASIFSSLASMMTDFTSIANTKIKPAQIDRAVENIQMISNSISPLLEAFQKLYGMEMGTTSGVGRTVAERRGAGAAGKSISSTYGAQAQGFAKMMEQLGETLESVSKIIGKLNKMRGKIDEMKANFGDNFDLSSLGTIMDSITTAFEKAGVNVGSYDLAPSNMEYINEALKYLYRALKKMNKIKGLLDGLEGSEGDFTSIGDTIGQMVSDLIAACSNAPQLQEYIDQLTETIDSIQELIDSIPPEYKKKTKVKINGTVDDEVSPKVRKAIRAIQASVNAIPSSITKVVTIRLVGNAVAAGVRGAEAAMAALQNQQHGGRIYRAGGGSLRRGTDTVQAMLTPGEWVMNRHATSMLGDDVLTKLNHLDIRGALNSLSLRAGQIQSKTVNNNSTKNANITVNNYHSDGVGYSRAGRFVRAL